MLKPACSFHSDQRGGGGGGRYPDILVLRLYNCKCSSLSFYLISISYERYIIVSLKKKKPYRFVCETKI